MMMIIGILTTLAIPSFKAAIKSAQEAVLKEDLRVMRSAIDSYTMDKQKAPQSLDDLVQEGYLEGHPRRSDDASRARPGSRTRVTLCTHWIKPIQASTMCTPESQDTGSDGQPYSAW